MRRHFFVVGQDKSGRPENTPLKEWLTHHSDHIPPGLDPEQDTSWTLAAGLKKRGWTAAETEGEVRLKMPLDTSPGAAAKGESETTRAMVSAPSESSSAMRRDYAEYRDLL